jgi:hypothetical protein
MKHYELLRQCADRLEAYTHRDAADQKEQPGIVLCHPHGTGRFVFAGGGSELLSATTQYNNYWVPVSRILTALGKALKEQYP